MEDDFLQLSLNLHALFLIFLDALVLTMAAIVANQHLHLLSVVRVEFPVKMMLKKIIKKTKQKKDDVRFDGMPKEPCNQCLLPKCVKKGTYR